MEKKEENVGEKFENKHITKRAEIFYINQNTAPPHKNVEVLLYILIISPTSSSDTRRVKLRYACEKAC